MKNKLLTLALASTLLLGNGCEERKPRQVYTSNEGNTEITLKDYWHMFSLEIETPEGKRTIYAEKYCIGDEEAHVTSVTDCIASSTNKYFRYSEDGRKILKEAQSMFDKRYNTFMSGNLEAPIRRFNIETENSNLFKQLE